MNVKKFFMSFLIFCLLIPLFGFGHKVFIKLFFNDFLVETPNLISMPYINAKNDLKLTTLSISQIGEDFSKYDKDCIYSQLPEPGKIIKAGRTIKVWVSKGKKEIKIPDFSNINLTEAKILAERKGLKIKNISYAYHKYAYNRVVTSDPPAGNTVGDNSEISFLVSIKSDSQNLYMPDLIGVNLKEAEKIFAKTGLIIGKTDYINDSMLENNVILDTEPKPGEKIKAGTVVNLIINQN